METNAKQFPKLQLYDLKVPEQTKKGQEKTICPQFTQNGGIQFDPNFWAPCPL